MPAGRIHEVAFALALSAFVATPALAGWKELAAPADVDRLVQLPLRRSTGLR